MYFRNVEEAKRYGYKKSLVKEFKVYVNGRLFEISHTEDRKNEIVPILTDLYRGSEVTVEKYNHYEWIKVV